MPESTADIPEGVRDAVALRVRDSGRAQAERDLQARLADTAPDSPERDKVLAALAALRRGAAAHRTK